MKNTEVASRLYEIADFLEMQDIEYKPRAYRNAARSIEALSEDIEAIHERDELQDIEGIGESIAEKIAEYLDTGELEYYQHLKADLPVDVEALIRVEGLGPKRVKQLHDALGVATLDDLEDAAEDGRIASVEDFGEQIQENVLEQIETAKRGEERMLLGKIVPTARDLETHLHDAPVFDQVDVVGSFRRHRPTVGDLDILALASDSEQAMETFCTLDDVTEVIERGETRSSVTLSDDLQADLRIVDEASYGAALVYFTGSKDHNITLRNRAIDNDWKLNEYGLFDAEDDKLAGETEAEVYAELGLSWIPPELREETGEIDAAEADALPDLVQPNDIRGDLHVHTTASDGDNTIREMAEHSASNGLEYVLITDHGPALSVVGGPSEAEFMDQKEAIDDANDATDVTVLHGLEANITDEGLDISQEWAAECDLLVAALHDSPDQPTENVINAFDAYPVDIFAHPLNRLLNERDPLDFDLDTLVETAAEERIAFEINAQPERLDFDWRSVKQYRGDVPFVVSTDAHSTAELDALDLGVAQAQRGWCEADHVLNTNPLDELQEYFA